MVTLLIRISLYLSFYHINLYISISKHAIIILPRLQLHLCHIGIPVIQSLVECPSGELLRLLRMQHTVYENRFPICPDKKFSESSTKIICFIQIVHILLFRRIHIQQHLKNTQDLVKRFTVIMANPRCQLFL